MRWENLKEMRCPRCGCGLFHRHGNSPIYGNYACKGHCGFGINQVRFDEVVASLYKTKAPREEEGDNLADLNNLGREKQHHGRDDEQE